MGSYVFDFEDVGRADNARVGGKGANLGELAKIKGINVPGGFCVSTEAYSKVVLSNADIRELIGRLGLVNAQDLAGIGEAAAKIRAAVERSPILPEIAEEISRHLSIWGREAAYAVRSSATAEDLPTASFAGQQDTYLNVVGQAAVLEAVRKCWASLFTDRAVAYRIQNGFDHSKVSLAVVIQEMVVSQISGVMFTADPATSNRKTVSIDASFGLGEALVSGIVNSDTYMVRDGAIVGKRISAKKRVIVTAEGGGTEERKLASGQQCVQALPDECIVELAQVGRMIEAHFGQPQDIEWCLVDGRFSIVQSRPITTLFPIPDAGDSEKHVWISTGHQQMMTDAMSPLGLAIYRQTAGPGMRSAAGRLFVDVASILAEPEGRKAMIGAWGQSDVLIQDALKTISERSDFFPQQQGHDAEDVGSGGKKEGHRESSAEGSDGPRAESNGESPDRQETGTATDPSRIVAEYDAHLVPELIAQNETSVTELQRTIATKAGAELVDFIVEDIQRSKSLLFDPQSMKVIVGGMNAASWLQQNLEAWLGERDAADVLAQSVPHNITAEMGMALLDVADAIRPHAEVIAYLQQADDEGFLEGLGALQGGSEAKAALSAFLEAYGMRCPGEIDIARPRWSEKPTMLVPAILSNVKNFEPGESRRRFAQGLREAKEKERQVLKRLAELPDGQQKAAEAKHVIELLRGYAGYREYPKYGKVRRDFLYKQALQKEAQKLVEAGVIEDRDDIFYLDFDELRSVVETGKLSKHIISSRKEEYIWFAKLTPPRVMTSDGEIIEGSYAKEGLPDGSLAGLPVSPGVVEGRARVILDMEDAELGEEDILVTVFTDPSWTPLFLGIKGLVTEVGGLMTHGAVIAREYGLPAVIGVEDATKIIQDGQFIRVNGAAGYVEIL